MQRIFVYSKILFYDRFISWFSSNDNEHQSKSNQNWLKILMIHNLNKITLFLALKCQMQALNTNTELSYAISQKS